MPASLSFMAEAILITVRSLKCKLFDITALSVRLSMCYLRLIALFRSMITNTEQLLIQCIKKLKFFIISNPEIIVKHQTLAKSKTSQETFLKNQSLNMRMTSDLFIIRSSLH